MTDQSMPASAGFDVQSALFTFNGRLRRSHFWIGWLVLLGAGVVAKWVPLFGGLILLALIIPNTALAVKRLHDMGQSGWLAMIGWLAGVGGVIGSLTMLGVGIFTNFQAFENEDFLAILAAVGPGMGVLMFGGLVVFVFLLWIGLSDSKPGSNKYGPNPKGQ